ncbi:MAG TPA: PepSY domain-containing protein [Steroidobacteraceae bacterium]|nr:PepSY domain-containing protein [Steroidobacteraceae bacterium]
MNAVRSWVVGGLALVLSSGALAVCAQGARPPVSHVAAGPPASHRHGGVSMDKAVRLAQHHFRARVVRAETQRQGDRTIYVLRMLDDSGRVFAVRVDAASGAII